MQGCIYVWRVYDIMIHTYSQTALFGLALTGSSHEDPSRITIELLNSTCLSQRLCAAHREPKLSLEDPLDRLQPRLQLKRNDSADDCQVVKADKPA